MSQLNIEYDEAKIERKNEAKDRSFSPLALDDEEDDDGENLEAEMLKLLSEIENSNSNAAPNEGKEDDSDDDADSMVDLTFNEEKLLKNIMDRVSVFIHSI